MKTARLLISVETYDTARIIGSELSLEEEDLLIQESGDNANRVEAMLAETERVTQISEAIGDTAIVMNSEEPLTSREAGLIEKIGQTAAAGSTASPDSIIPSMEQYVGKAGTISVEGFDLSAKKIVDGILAVMKRVWEFIKAFHKTYIGQTARLRRSINRMRVRLKAATEVSVDPTIPFDTHRTIYQRNGKPLANTRELIEAFEQVHGVTSFATQFFPQNMTTIGTKIKEVFSNTERTLSNSGVDKDAAKDIISTAVSDVVNVSMGVFKMVSQRANQFPGHTGHRDEAVGFDETMSGNLLDNANLIGLIPYSVDGEIPIDRVRNACFVLNMSTTSYPPHLNIKPFNTPSLAEVRTILNIADQMLVTLDDTSEIDRLSSLADQIAKVSESLSSKMESRLGLAYRGDLTDFRTLINFNSVLARWSAEPSIATKRYAARVTTAMLMVVDSALKAHGI